MSDEKRYGSDPTYPAASSGKIPLRTIPASVIAEKLRRSTVPPPEVAQTIATNQSGPQEARETRFPCPCCADCLLCRGSHTVTATVLASYEASVKESAFRREE